MSHRVIESLNLHVFPSKQTSCSVWKSRKVEEEEEEEGRHRVCVFPNVEMLTLGKINNCTFLVAGGDYFFWAPIFDQHFNFFFLERSFVLDHMIGSRSWLVIFTCAGRVWVWLNGAVYQRWRAIGLWCVVSIVLVFIHPHRKYLATITICELV